MTTSHAPFPNRTRARFTAPQRRSRRASANFSPARALRWGAAPRLLGAALCCVVFAWRGAEAKAHEGPPFPILMDQSIPGYLVEVWADPDIGEATFYVVLAPQPASANASPPEVSVWVQPVSQRLDKATYPTKQQAMRERLQFLAEPHFDRQEMWNVGIVVVSSRGERSELVTEVEATPPGAGAWDLLIYLFPFVFFGGLWAFGLLRRWRAESRAAPPHAPGVHGVVEEGTSRGP